jgi:allantoicase
MEKPVKDLPSVGWNEILPRTKLGPHRRHYFQLDNVEGKPYTHVKVTIHPDGGLKRVRLIGKRADQPIQRTGITDDKWTSSVNENRATDGANNGTEVLGVSSSTNTASASSTIPLLPLTPEAFMPFGKVIQAYEDHNAAPRETKITPANQGTASKYHKLGLLASKYPSETGATTGLSVYRCNPLPPCDDSGAWDVKTLERHSFTTQAFIPMGAAGSFNHSENGLIDPGNGYLVVVAKNGLDEKPDPKTLRAFSASAAQGIMYNVAIWRKYLQGSFSKNSRINLHEYRPTDGCF